VFGTYVQSSPQLFLYNTRLSVDSLDDKPVPRPSRTMMDRSEVFVFDYGVVVLWNFTEEEEESLLAKLRQFAEGISVDDDIDCEEFHFQYEQSASNRPRSNLGLF
jgi:uncharacterized Rmd1/YagE family protein